MSNILFHLSGLFVSRLHIPSLVIFHMQTNIFWVFSKYIRMVFPMKTSLFLHFFSHGGKKKEKWIKKLIFCSGFGTKDRQINSMTKRNYINITLFLFAMCIQAMNWWNFDDSALERTKYKCWIIQKLQMFFYQLWMKWLSILVYRKIDNTLLLQIIVDICWKFSIFINFSKQLLSLSVLYGKIHIMKYGSFLDN